MQMEAETISMFVLSFSIVIFIGLAAVAGLWYKYKNSGLLWFLPQFGFLILAFLKILYLIQVKPEISEAMLSEENSGSIGIIGVYWTMSMVFMLIGIWRLNRNRIKDNS